MQEDLFVYIMAGGDGTRLWPASTAELPKQFLALSGSMSMLQHTILRNCSFANPVTVITTQKHLQMAMRQSYEVNQDVQLLVEQCGQGTLVAAIAAALDALTKHANPYVLLLPSDHHILDDAAYKEAIMLGLKVLPWADLALFGVPAESGYAGYGYIELGVQEPHVMSNVNVTEGRKVWAVQAFHEKPSAEQAAQLVAQGHVLWNAGIFAFNAERFLELVVQHEIQAYNAAIEAFKQAFYCQKNTYLGVYGNEPLPQSLDRSICHKAKNIAVVELGCCWYDLGSWFGIRQWLQSMPLDDVGSASSSNQLAQHTNGLYLDSQRCFFLSGKSILALGLKDIALVEGDEILMLLDLTTAERMDALASSLSKEDYLRVSPRQHDWLQQNMAHSEAGHAAAGRYKVEEKPWGYEVILSLKPTAYAVKELHIYPGEQTSLQYHRYREEHLFVVAGEAMIAVDDQLIPSSQAIYAHVPSFSRHRIKNIGDVELVIVEVQLGNWIDSSDIVRLADDYGRQKE